MTGKRRLDASDEAARTTTSSEISMPISTGTSTSGVLEAASPSKVQRTMEPGRILRDEIELTANETKLFDFLLDVEKQYDCKATLRVAGGWVRDKLLGRDSDDVDIVLDTMTGKQFTDLINTYETDHGQKPHTVGVIKANRDQSKHLETATMALGEIGWVDFVNLRTETYSDEHRIPEMEFGTPLQDAERRDFTINSLFYNIAEHRVEDFTGRGVEDLRHGRLCTPLDPGVTFLDDPLRVLRAVRFASRFNFVLEDRLIAAAQSKDVQDALMKKVSRERVGKELLGMLTGSSAHPRRALRFIHDLGLCKSVFLPPVGQPFVRVDGTALPPLESDDTIWEKGYAYAAAMYNLLEARTANGELVVATLSEDEQHTFKIRILSAFLLPFSECYVLVKKRQHSVPYLIVRESLKLRTRDAEDVGNVVLKNISVLHKEVEAHADGSAGFDRVRVGLMLRDIGPLWELCRDVALVKALNGTSTLEESAAIRTQFDNFSAAVIAHDLVGVWEMKPLLNGNELIKEAGVKPGPGIKQALDRVIEWQLAHPMADREQCLLHLRNEAGLAGGNTAS